MSAKRLYLAVAAVAVVVHLGALWNRFAMDDLYIVAYNPLVHAPSGLWQAFAHPYWPPDFGGKMYRPLVMSGFALDRLLDGTAWFHLVNVLWHAATVVAVAALARRWSGDVAALAAGLLFAVHPVHVEAVANVVGRAELMAALFTVLAVYAAVERDRVGWSAALLALGLLSKENAAVAPGLIACAWVLGFRRPDRRRMAAYVASWVVLAVAYAAVRWIVLHPYARTDVQAPVFIGASPFAVRLSAVAALADVVRLLVFPLTLRADYSPNERTLVTSLVDGRFLLGLAALGLWVGLLVWTWRRGRRTEALGLAWIGIAFLPVANILFPTGVLVAERTLYLPSAGLALAFGAWAGTWPQRKLAPVLAVLVTLGAVRTFTRVPVWRDDKTVTESMLDDSPASYRGPARAAGMFQSARDPARALDGYQKAVQIFDRDPTVFVGAADAAFTIGRPALADSLLARANQLCFRCVGYLRFQAQAARSRGDPAVADSLLARARAWEAMVP